MKNHYNELLTSFYQWDLEFAEVCLKRYKAGFLLTTAG